MRSMSVRWGLITGAASLALWQAPAFAQRDLADLLEEEDAKPGRPVATQPSDGAASDASPLGGENRKAAVPAAAAVKQGRVKVEDVFRRDVLEARTSEAKSSVAMQILKLAGETTPGADQYAMFIVALETAVSAAATLATPGVAVLLSPGCTSYDWYSNYKERGDDFVRLVRRHFSSSTDQLITSGGGNP